MDIVFESILMLCSKIGRILSTPNEDTDHQNWHIFETQYSVVFITAEYNPWHISVLSDSSLHLLLWPVFIILSFLVREWCDFAHFHWMNSWCFALSKWRELLYCIKHRQVLKELAEKNWNSSEQERESDMNVSYNNMDLLFLCLFMQSHTGRCYVS